MCEILSIRKGNIIRAIYKRNEDKKIFLPSLKTYFSLVTPVKGVPSCLTSIKRPVSLSRFTHCLVLGLKTCERFLTAPLRCRSLDGGFVAIFKFLYFSLLNYIAKNTLLFSYIDYKFIVLIDALKL